jgi:hypothetical protein
VGPCVISDHPATSSLVPSTIELALVIHISKSSRAKSLPMSGFEIAGIVLGTIPLVIAALEHYRAGKGVASSFIKWHGHLDTLVFRLKLQHTFFYLQIRDLLRESGVAEVIGCDDLREEDCITLLRDPKTGVELREYFGPLYETFLEILERYETCLRTISGKLGHLRRIPNVSLFLSSAWVGILG